MLQCAICSFLVDLDDAVAPNKHGRCVCLGCYLRETVTHKPMPAALRRELVALLEEVKA